jgi:hypothetical protein
VAVLRFVGGGEKQGGSDQLGGGGRKWGLGWDYCSAAPLRRNLLRQGEDATGAEVDATAPFGGLGVCVGRRALCRRDPRGERGSGGPRLRGGSAVKGVG